MTTIDENIGWIDVDSTSIQRVLTYYKKLKVDHYKSVDSEQTQTIINALSDLLEIYPNQILVADNPTFLYNGRFHAIRMQEAKSMWHMFWTLINELEAGKTIFINSIFKSISADIDDRSNKMITREALIFRYGLV